MTDAERSRNYRRRHPDRHKAATRRWRESNHEYKKQISREWARKRDPKILARNRRKQIYGITEQEYQEMIASQDNKCAICATVFVKTPQIDHDHITRQNRGLLCQFCNLVLGNAKDQISILENAIKYLRKYGESIICLEMR